MHAYKNNIIYIMEITFEFFLKNKAYNFHVNLMICINLMI